MRILPFDQAGRRANAPGDRLLSGTKRREACQCSASDIALTYYPLKNGHQ